MRSRRRSVLRLAAGSVLAGSLPSGAAADQDPFWTALGQPGVHVIMRHALAPGSGDPDTIRVGDCATQRNLNQAGRDQAIAIGQAFRDKDVRFDVVLSSQWCRCLETAELLGLANVEAFPPLNSFWRDRAAGPAQTRALLAFLRRHGSSERLMLVTHYVNIVGLLDQTTRSGEALAFRVDGTGAPEVLGAMVVPPAE